MMAPDDFDAILAAEHYAPFLTEAETRAIRAEVERRRQMAAEAEEKRKRTTLLGVVAAGVFVLVCLVLGAK